MSRLLNYEEYRNMPRIVEEEAKSHVIYICINIVKGGKKRSTLIGNKK